MIPTDRSEAARKSWQTRRLHQSVNQMSESEQIDWIKKDVSMLRYLTNPSEAVQLAAVKISPHNLEYFVEPRPSAIIAAIKMGFSYDLYCGYDSSTRWLQAWEFVYFGCYDDEESDLSEETIAFFEHANVIIHLFYWTMAGLPYPKENSDFQIQAEEFVDICLKEGGDFTTLKDSFPLMLTALYELHIVLGDKYPQLRDHIQEALADCGRYLRFGLLTAEAQELAVEMMLALY